MCELHAFVRLCMDQTSTFLSTDLTPGPSPFRPTASPSTSLIRREVTLHLLSEEPSALEVSRRGGAQQARGEGHSRHSRQGTG